jgi:hypothetical protein
LLDIDNEKFGSVRKDQVTSSVAVPLFFELFGRILMVGVFQIILALVFSMIHLLLAAFLFAFAVVRYIIRSIYNLIMFQVTKYYVKPNR